MDDAGPLLASKKAVAVATGEAHTLALTGDGCVYTWGRGMFGRLGTGSESDQLFPVRVNFDSPGRSKQDPPLKFVAVAAGAYHSLALADDGSIWCWGGENSAVPCLLKQFIELDSPDPLTDESEIKSKVSLKVCSVKAGGMMSLAIDILGALWMWGNCPQPSSSNEGVSSLVACGNEHVVALISAGETYKGEDLLCYSWGSNNHGQLGLGDKESRLHPEIIKTFNEDYPRAVYELGHGTTQSALFPELVKKLPQPVYLISVDCGLFHTSVLSSAGDVWSWGMVKGLGLCPDATFTGTDGGDAVSPLHIGRKFHDPVQVAFGAARTVIVEHDGYKLWSWGRGRSGVLGNGTFDIAKERENKLEAADHTKLNRLEMFYRNMLAGVKDKLMKRRIQEIVEECLPSSSIRQ
ncbi:hypothetical protein SO802_007362 [Lithocarpus litseifolius]|uniref:RCC1-like domain-containing protein n=1 Tax=Lithocarpus litseifolius TaxID=425828 RepID=A0AAW2DQ52_9ROSI